MLGIWWPAFSVEAGEEITCQSPNGKFALRCVSADSQPYNGETMLVELPSHKPVLSLNPNWTVGQVKLVWSPDSQRVAYFAESSKDSSTRIFQRTGSAFNEIELPELPSPKTPENVLQSDADTHTRIEAVRWIGPAKLSLEKELQNRAWGRAAARIALKFDQENRASIQKVEQEKTSIVDYFLLLPADQFEGPPSDLLRDMRTGGSVYLCDSESREKYVVDEKNGYMRCAGDGAQASFEAALFRYRDGRPLLALCSGELEGSASVYLYFYEMGGNGKM
ncbi:MAG: hypothetical protein M3Y80_03505 [Verrucomicrobiota bacterium]|nr:hypothetical protein [Verrucomicrobiota bacterium]